MNHDTTGRHALVTGGTKGIGEATARRLRDAGAEVVVAARRPPIALLPDGIDYVEADLAAPGGAQRLADTALARWDTLDVLVDNAGGQTVHQRVEEFTDTEWLADLQLNLLSAVALDRALLPAITRARGAIVHVGSTVARMPEAAVVAYASAKAALAVYSKALARQVGADGVRVNAVLPGFTATDMLVEHFRHAAQDEGVAYDEYLPAEMRRLGVALARPADPAEVAAAIVFLASDEASYLTGTQLMVEGGVYPGV